MPDNPTQNTRARALLTIAGTDPLCGAGCAADVATFRCFGWPALAVETAYVAQNSCGVRRFLTSPTDIFAERLYAVFEDCDVAAIKVGMMADTALVQILAEVLGALSAPPPVVLDPVGAGGGLDGAPLYHGRFDRAFDALFPHITLLTPNAMELSALAGSAVNSHDEGREAAQRLHDRGVRAVLIKGGHLEPAGRDGLSIRGEGVHTVHEGNPWSVSIHGTGCHLSSAITARIARGDSLSDAATTAAQWLHRLVEQKAYHTVGRGRPQLDARDLHRGFAAASR